MVGIEVQVCIVIVAGLLCNLLGKWLVELVTLPRVVWWILILIPFVLTHFYLQDAAVFARMVGLCGVLLLGMKLIVYREWIGEGGAKIPFIKWLHFAWLWFGMEPRAWIVKKRCCEWKSHGVWGTFCLVIGALGMSVLCWFDTQFFVPYFIFMSMMFHFGVLRLLTAFWRWRGVPVRVLFRNPIVLSGFRDFWSKRWNLAYSHMMARAVQRPLKKVLGQKGSMFAVFVVSGVFHEFAITVPAGGGYGLPTLFFVVHGLAAVIERDFWWQRYACLGMVIAGLPVLFPEIFVNEVIWPIKEIWILWIK